MKKLVVTILLSTLLASLTLYPKIRHVYEADGAGAIQDSINVSTLDDTVMIHNGKYYVGELNDILGLRLNGSKLMSVSKDSVLSCTLTGLSENGLDTAIHVIYDSIPVISCLSIIQGFTITEGKYSPGSYNYGGGISVSGDHWTDSIITLIQYNYITDNMGGIGINYCGGVKIQCNHILHNRGAGITSWGVDPPAIVNNIIKFNENSNQNWGYGGGIYVESGITECRKNDIKGEEDCNTKIVGNIITQNYALECGGGIALGYCIGGEVYGNVIAYNEAGVWGGGISCGGGMASYTETRIRGNTVVGNIASAGGGFEIHPDIGDKVFCEKLLALDNGSIDEKSGLLTYGGEYFEMDSSNIYYNTYQQDVEVYSDTSWNDSFPMENNFWWVSDSSRIDSLIDGHADFIPFENHFVPDVPGEPTEIYSVLNYSSDYSSVIDSLGGDPDTLYLEITGHDRNHEFQEAAIAILKSDIYPVGIAIALLETKVNSGIYRWKGVLKTTNPPDSIRMDDMKQTIRVDPDGDTIKIIANMDTSEIFKVYYRCQGGGVDDSADDFVTKPIRNPVFDKLEFRFFLPEESRVKITIYDVSGRLVKNIETDFLSTGWHTIKGNVEKSGVYLYRIETLVGKRRGKITIIK